MAYQQHDLPAFPRGDTHAIPLKYRREGADEDLTNWVLWFTVKHDAQQPDEEAVIQKQIIIDGSSSVVVLTSEDTQNLPVGKYVYDLQLVSPNGDAVKTMVMGKLTLQKEVTHRTRLTSDSITQ